MRRILIQHGTLLSFGKPCRVLEGHEVLVEGDRIAAIAPAGRAPGPFAEVLDATGMVVMPGLINAHMHFYSTFARGFTPAAPSKDFTEVLRNLWWRLDKALTLEDARTSALVMALEAVRHGCTTLVDHHASPGAVEGSLDAVAGAVKEAGIRACLCYEVSDRDGKAVRDAGLAENARFVRRCRDERDPQLRALFGLHAAFTLSDESLDLAAGMARDLATGFHIHLAEAESDQAHSLTEHGERVVPRLRRHGILGPGTLAAHGVHLMAPEMAELAETGATVATNPQSNLNNAVGIADLVGLRRAGVPVALGTDAMTVDMLEEARVALWAQHRRQDDASAGWGVVTESLTVENPRLASRLWGFPLGTLEAGAAADLILVPYDPPTPMDEGNALGHLLFGISQARVDTTVCGGRVLMKGRNLCLNLDEAGLAERSRDLARQLWRRL
ncbi:MAG: putative aminohydrolase SsnA [Acidobacteria bacterium]|nr:putative aminohydrolase SsnA [Acidobacteriota bacterium]